jgi:hypothetical protein
MIAPEDLGSRELHHPGGQPSQASLFGEDENLSWQFDLWDQPLDKGLVLLGPGESPGAGCGANAEEKQGPVWKIPQFLPRQPTGVTIGLRGQKVPQRTELLVLKAVVLNRIARGDRGSLALGESDFGIVPVEACANVVQTIGLTGRSVVLLKNRKGVRQPLLVGLVVVNHLEKQPLPFGVADFQKMMAEHDTRPRVVWLASEHVAEERLSRGYSTKLGGVARCPPESLNVLNLRLWGGDGRIRCLYLLSRGLGCASMPLTPASQSASPPVGHQVRLDGDQTIAQEYLSRRGMYDRREANCPGLVGSQAKSKGSFIEGGVSFVVSGRPAQAALDPACRVVG